MPPEGTCCWTCVYNDSPSPGANARTELRPRSAWSGKKRYNGGVVVLTALLVVASDFSRNLSELFSKDEIVYLTAESPTVLSRLEQGHVYVIGGIVDHNRIKGHCHAQALKAGWKTAKLLVRLKVRSTRRWPLPPPRLLQLLVSQSLIPQSFLSSSKKH